MSTSVLTDFGDGVAVITINRPGSRNAINREVAEGIAAAIDEMEARDDVVVGILTGNGGTFCAGMDLKAFVDGDVPSIAGRGFAGLVERPPTKPLIAAVEGWALAGGCEIALSADLIVASRDAKFGLPEVKRGLVAAGGGLLRLPKAVPYQIAMEVVLTGDPITAERAHHFGLVNSVTEPGQALAGARDLAVRIAANGPLAVRSSKKILSGAVEWTAAERFERQIAVTDQIFASEDAQEGALAFAEKRAPVWRGR